MGGGWSLAVGFGHTLALQDAPDRRYRQAFHGLLSAEKFAQFFGPAGFEVLADSGAHVLDTGHRNIFTGGVVGKAPDNGNASASLPFLHRALSLSLTLSQPN